MAFEIALVLESLGHQVALVIIMDTPRREQIRQLCEPTQGLVCPDEDALEMMEMILGALGKQPIGPMASDYVIN